MMSQKKPEVSGGYIGFKKNINTKIDHHGNSIQVVALSTDTWRSPHIIVHCPAPFASSSSVLPRSCRPDASATAAGALPYSETRPSWRVFPVVILQADWWPFHSDCIEISNPVRPP